MSKLSEQKEPLSRQSNCPVLPRKLRSNAAPMLLAKLVKAAGHAIGMDSANEQQTSMIGGGLLLFALFRDGLTGALEDEAIKAMEWKHGQVLQQQHTMVVVVVVVLGRSSTRAK